VAEPANEARIGNASARLVLATAPDAAVAKKIALALLERRLVACVNVMPGVTSHYRWQGQLEEASEVLLFAKTSVDRLAALESAFHELHPYDTPEFIVVAADHVAPRYLAWLSEETH
jgi:periplasmic divalent cation tolerance protein